MPLCSTTEDPRSFLGKNMGGGATSFITAVRGISEPEE